MASPSSIIVKASVFLAIACWPCVGLGQEATRKTSLSDAIGLIDAAAAAVQHRHEADPRRRTIELEIAASFVMLDAQDRMADSLDRLVKAIRPEDSPAESRRIRLWLAQAAGLAIAQGDAARAKHIVNRASLKWYDVELAIEALGPWTEKSALALEEAVGVADRRLRYVLCRDGQVSILRRVLKPSGEATLVELDEIGEVGLVDSAIAQAKDNQTIDMVSLIWLARRQAFRGRVSLARRLVAEAAREELRPVMTAAVANWQYSGWEQRCPWRVPDVAPDEPRIGVVHAAWRPGPYDHGSYDGRPMVPLADLAEALSGGDDGDGESRRLLDGLKTLVDLELARQSADRDQPSGLVHHRRPDGGILPLFKANRETLANIRARIELASFAAGSPVVGSRSLPGRASDYIDFIVNFPNGRLAARVLKNESALKAVFADSEEHRQVMAFANFALGQATRLGAFPSDDRRMWFEERLNRIVESLIHVERKADALRVVEAVKISLPGFRWNANTLFSIGKVDDAKGELRLRLADQFAARRYAAAIALQALGESVDFLKLLLKPDAEHRDLRDWILAIGITADTGDPVQVAAMIRSAPVTLRDADVDVAEATRLDAEGIYAVSLARHGDLESALKRLASRNLPQRWLFHGPRSYVTGYDFSTVSVFDMPFVVLQWAARGHAGRP